MSGKVSSAGGDRLRKTFWVVVTGVLVLVGLGSLVVGLMFVFSLEQGLGVGPHIELKDRIENMFEADETVVAIDRSDKEANAIEVRLTYEDPPWKDGAERDDLLERVGRFAWRNFAESPGDPLERVTVVLYVQEGMGCSGPREAARAAVPDPREPRGPPGRRPGGEGSSEKDGNEEKKEDEDAGSGG